MTNAIRQAKRSRRRVAFVYLPILLLLFTLGWFSYSQIAWVEYQTDQGITEQARNNPYLAATIFLQDQGVSVRSERSFQAFDQVVNYHQEASAKPQADSDIQQIDSANQQASIGNTLVLVDAYGSLSEQRMENLLAWVGQGGHLIASASNHYLDNPADVSDPLFEHFGVVIDRQNGAGIEQELWELINRYGYLAGVAGAELCPLLVAQSRFSFSGDDSEMGVHFLSTDLLQATGRDPDAWVGDASFAYMLQFDVGDGRVSLVSSLDLWKNSAIGCLDHAWFLWRLAPEGGVMTLFSNFEFPGVAAALWRYFDTTIVTATLLLLLWLWYRGVRFGPIRETHALRRRQLLEHIDASANFLWRVGKADSLVVAARTQILQQIRQQHPQLFTEAAGHDLNNHELASGNGSATTDDGQQVIPLAVKLSPLLGLSVEQIHQALWQPTDNNSQSITEILSVLQILKEKI